MSRGKNVLDIITMTLNQNTAAARLLSERRGELYDKHPENDAIDECISIIATAKSKLMELQQKIEDGEI